MKRWHVRPVRRDQAGAPAVDIRSKITGGIHAQVRRGTQFALPELLLSKKLTDEERLKALRALKLPGMDDTMRLGDIAKTLKEIAKLMKMVEGLKLPNKYEFMRRNRKWHLARR